MALNKLIGMPNFMRLRNFRAKKRGASLLKKISDAIQCLTSHFKRHKVFDEIDETQENN